MDLNNKKVNILGTEYSIEERECKDDVILNNADGYSDWTVNLLVIEKCEQDDMSLKDLERYKKKVLRHEIIHAFLDQSGLACNSNWARNEEMVDFFAIQIPKIVKAYKDLNILD